MVTAGLLPPAALILLVLGSILLGWASPTEAAGVGRQVTDALERTALTGGMLFGIFIRTTAFSLVFQILGGYYIVGAMVENSGFGVWGVLALLMAIVFLLGFFLDWIEITLIALPIFVPIVELLDFGGHVAQPEMLYWFAILMAINLQTSFLTPPFGFALFYLKGSAPPDLPIQTIWRGAAPFVVLQLIALALVITFPDIALWLPRTHLN